MKRTLTNEWMLLLAFMVFGVSAFSLFYLLAKNMAPAATSTTSARTEIYAYNDGLIQSGRVKITLYLDQEITLGKAKLIYRGLEGRRKFKIDVVILDLDPQTAYTYHLNIKDAKQAFRLVNQQFKLISARKSQLRLWLLEP